MRPPVPYYGGKSSIAHRIASLLPQHRHYVEPFAGSLAVLLAKSPSELETVNDLDEDLVTFWRVLRDDPDELARVCEMTPHSRAEFYSSRHLDCADLERARRVWVLLTQGRTPALRRCGWRFQVAASGNNMSRPEYQASYVARIHAAAHRLRNVSLDCRPGLEIVKLYGSESSVLLYVDPPYLGEVRAAGYRHEMTDAIEHVGLLDALLQCDAAVVLSGYASELYDAALAGWSRVEMTVGTGNSGPGYESRTEVVWCNRPIHDGRLEGIA